ncbi:cupin domain-containing protein [Vogesella sp. XCS3]|uniref:cupin domain-containing protein n=1 Tax=Vogesella sp. XCS3 TaxID=2877939 RepID=UPI001D0AE25B|nr:cupin domain-containing protein [Vogesella sp. XCS3]UDM15839.1 cupin domain-containing protein [Vogesella sp. XCS3]
MSSANDIVLFHHQDITPDTFAAPLERRLSGECEQSVELHYSDPTGQFHAGLWSGGVGAWRVKYTECEFCTLLEGHVRLLGDDGSVADIRAGQHFVIPAGFEGVWEVLEPAKKTFAVFEEDRLAHKED